MFLRNRNTLKGFIFWLFIDSYNILSNSFNNLNINISDTKNIYDKEYDNVYILSERIKELEVNILKYNDLYNKCTFFYFR